MSTLTLPEFVKRTRDQLIAGIVEDIYTMNPIWNYVPWIGFAGSGLSVNREVAMGDAEFLAIGGTITAKSPSEVDQILFQPTTLLGDAEINKLEVAMSNSDINDVVATEVSSKAKNIGRQMQNGFVNGNGTSPLMNGLLYMVDSEQIIAPAANTALDFELLDQLQTLVVSKDGIVDWIMMHSRELLAYRTLCRQLGGVPMMEVRMGNKTIMVEEFNGIPIFRNDWIAPVTAADGNVIYAGVWDDGSKKIGSAMIYPQATTAGIQFEQVGAMESRDEDIYRVKAYMNSAIFNRRGIAMLTNIGGAVTVRKQAKAKKNGKKK
jgi:HK97 family phage major capsid protein